MQREELKVIRSAACRMTNSFGDTMRDIPNHSGRGGMEVACQSADWPVKIGRSSTVRKCDHDLIRSAAF